MSRRGREDENGSRAAGRRKRAAEASGHARGADQGEIETMLGKIAVEEHFEMPDAVAAANNAFRPDYLAEAQRRLVRPDLRIEEMDACGIEMQVLSLTEPGIQGIADREAAVARARQVNDHIAEAYVAAHPDRFAGLAVVALQDPAAAADELERAVTQLGLKGVMINGFTNIDGGENVRYLDETPCRPFWERAQALGVPVFLHPRVPLPTQRRALRGFDGIAGSAWGFGRETAEHVIRLILSGLFDRLPDLTLVLGHLAEGLLFALPRMEMRLRHQAPGSHGAHRHPPTYYLRKNIIVSTSGIFDTAALHHALLTIGADRLLFAIDYPFESNREIAAWFDTCPISESDRLKIGRTNAMRLLKLDLPEPVV
jgi:2,3-dihydroxybenzoate decarboxylase